MQSADKIDRAKVVKLTTLAERRFNALGDAVENGLTTGSFVVGGHGSAVDNSLERLIVDADAGSSGSSRTRRVPLSASSPAVQLMPVSSSPAVQSRMHRPSMGSSASASSVTGSPLAAAAATPTPPRITILSVRTPGAPGSAPGSKI